MSDAKKRPPIALFVVLGLALLAALGGALAVSTTASKPSAENYAPSYEDKVRDEQKRWGHGASLSEGGQGAGFSKSGPK